MQVLTLYYWGFPQQYQVTLIDRLGIDGVIHNSQGSKASRQIYPSVMLTYLVKNDREHTFYVLDLFVLSSPSLMKRDVFILLFSLDHGLHYLFGQLINLSHQKGRDEVLFYVLDLFIHVIKNLSYYYIGLCYNTSRNELVCQYLVSVTNTSIETQKEEFVGNVMICPLSYEFFKS